jgi:hypothetical protein
LLLRPFMQLLPSNFANLSAKFMMVKKAQIDWILLFLFGLLSLFFIIIFYTSLPDSYLDQLFNTDSLYLPSLYNDFFIEHGKVTSWNFNSSPNFVPDMLLYFPMNGIIGNFRLTAIVFSLVQQIIIMFLVYSILKRFFGKDVNLYFGLVVLLSVIFLLAFLIGNEYYLSFLYVSHTFHVGTFVMALICLNLSFVYIKKKQNGIFVLMLLLQLIAFLSDRLFLILFTAPAFFTFILFWKNRQYLVLAISQIFIGLTGFIVFNNLNEWFQIKIGSPHRINQISYFFEALQVLIKHFSTILARFDVVSLIWIMAIASFVAGGIIVVRNYRKILFVAQPDLSLVYLLFSTFFFPMVIIAPLLNGNYTGFDTVRYIIFAFYLAIFNIPFILWSYCSQISSNVVRITGIIIFALLFGYGIFLTSKINPVKQIAHILNYYPPYVEMVDQVVADENLKFGLANYWDAKYITMFSKSGVKIYAALDDLNAYYHVSNQDWYYGCSTCDIGVKEFNFIIFDRFAWRDVINQLMNQDSRLIHKENLELLITKPFVMSRLTYKPVFKNN